MIKIKHIFRYIMIKIKHISKYLIILIMNNNLINAAYATGFLTIPYLVRKVKRVTYPQKSIFYNRYLMPVVYIASYYYSAKYLSMVTLNGFGILSWIVEKNITLYTYYQLFSLITFVVGYPALYALGSLGVSFIDSTFKSYKPIILTGLALFDNFTNAIKNNDNWDVRFGNISLRTCKSTTLMSEYELNEVLPLKSRRNGNSSHSSHLECSVCTENINNDMLHRELPCNHVFHPECIDQWLLKCNAICPNCRQAIIADEE